MFRRGNPSCALANIVSGKWIAAGCAFAMTMGGLAVRDDEQKKCRLKEVKKRTRPLKPRYAFACLLPRCHTTYQTTLRCVTC